jgi:hypothetical protein
MNRMKGTRQMIQRGWETRPKAIEWPCLAPFELTTPATQRVIQIDSIQSQGEWGGPKHNSQTETVTRVEGTKRYSELYELYCTDDE